MLKRRVVIALLGSALGLSALAAVRTATFHAESMGTAQAARQVTAAIKSTPGVLDAAADPAARIVMVRYESTKTTVLDISDAAAEAGYTLSIVAPGAQTGSQASQRSLEAMKEFAVVLNQTREARHDGKYGLVRNLMPAMKLRRDAVVAAEKGASATTRQKAGSATTYQLALDLSRQVDALASAAEAKQKNKVDADIPEVRKAFEKLAKASNYDEMVAPLEPASTQSKPQSLEDELMQKIKDLTK